MRVSITQFNPDPNPDANPHSVGVEHNPDQHTDITLAFYQGNVLAEPLRHRMQGGV